MQKFANLNDLDKDNKNKENKANNLLDENGKYNMDHFANRIKKLRYERDLTQVELGELVDKTRGTIGHWETKNREPNLTSLIKLSNVFNCSIDYLLGKTDIRRTNHINNFMINKLKEAGYIDNGKVRKKDIQNFVEDLELIKNLRSIKS